MRETIVVLWCDQHHADDGSKVTATVRVVPSLDGQAVNLDLCQECADKVRAVHQAWMKIGEPGRGRKRPAGRPPASSDRAEFLARLRDWCDTRSMQNPAGTGPSYETASGKRNYDQAEPPVHFLGGQARHMGPGPVAHRATRRGRVGRGRQRDRTRPGVKPATPAPELHDCRSDPKG
jgi:hypothetical protein